MRHIREDLKQMYPGLWEKTYVKKQRAPAIRLFCTECMGGNAAEVRHCSDKTCPLFSFRMGRQIGGSVEPETAAETNTTGLLMHPRVFGDNLQKAAAQRLQTPQQ